MDNIDDDVKALADALKASEQTVPTELVEGAALNTEDQMELAKKYLTDKALSDLGRKALGMIAKSDDGSCAMAIFLGTRVRSTEIEKGVEKVCKAIKELSEQNLIHSALSPLISVKFARMPLEAETSAVVCYVLVPEAQYQDLQESYKNLTVTEGDMPKSVDGDNFKPVLNDGEFLAEIRTSVYLASTSRKSPKELLQDEIDAYLSILPKGTVVKEITECAITDLSMPYEVKFFNPLFKKVKTVSLDWARDCEMIDGKLEQFNVFLGVRYYGADGKEWFTSYKRGQ